MLMFAVSQSGVTLGDPYIKNNKNTFDLIVKSNLLQATLKWMKRIRPQVTYCIFSSGRQFYCLGSAVQGNRLK